MPRTSGHRPRANGRRPGTSAGFQIAHAAVSAAGPAVLELHLIPAARYDSLLQSSTHGLYATITVTFTSAGHPALRQILRVSFPHRPPIYDLPKPGYPLPGHRPPGHPARKHPRPRHIKHRGKRR